MPKILRLVASRCGQLINHAALASSLGMPQTTLKRYLGILESTFLTRPLPAWSVNIGTRLIKSPKIYLSDTGLLTHLLGVTRARLTHDSTLTGMLLENLVVMELVKDATWSTTRPNLFYFRTAGGAEVDIILERKDGTVVGIEVKAGRSVSGSDFRGLRLLAEQLGRRFHRGIILYGGQETVPFDKSLAALPISSIWR
jgi:predicted AAA+ superfamily ATPase